MKFKYEVTLVNGEKIGVPIETLDGIEFAEFVKKCSNHLADTDGTLILHVLEDKFSVIIPPEKILYVTITKDAQG